MPDWKQEIRQRLAIVKLEPTREAAIVEELAQYLDDCYEELISGGLTPAEAERRTLEELSGSEILTRELRRPKQQAAPEPIALGSNRRTNMFADLWQDLRYGARMLIKNPGFTLITVATLSLGIGANTAIFSVINGVFLNPLAYYEPERLMMIWEKLTRGQLELSPEDYLEYERRNQVFAQMGAAEGGNFNLTGGREPVHVDGQAATASLFPLLGVQPMLGRTFTKEEDDANAPVVVLSHRLWQVHFGSNAAILNQTIRLNDKSYTVIGVMPPGFHYPPPIRQTPLPSDLWIPRSLITEKSRN